MTHVVDKVADTVGGIGDMIFGTAPSKPQPPTLAPVTSPSFIDNAPASTAASESLLAPADPSNGTAQADRDAAAEAERKRVAGARGFNSTNPTGGAGDLSTPNLATKSLLGS